MPLETQGFSSATYHFYKTARHVDFKRFSPNFVVFIQYKARIAAIFRPYRAVHLQQHRIAFVDGETDNPGLPTSADLLPLW